MRFAIVDDETIVLEQLPQLIRNLIQDMNIEIECFHSGAELQTAFNLQKFDALFLDIDMPGISGFDLAEQFRMQDDNILIVYVTGRDDLITTAFRYKPIGFVRKQRIDIELPFALSSIILELKRKKAAITVTEIKSVGGKTHTILISNIIYIESSKHYLYFHLIDGTQLTIRGILSDFLNQSNFKSFVKINSGTIVNLEHTNLDKNQVILDNGTVLFISRRKLSDVKKAYLKYVKKVLI